jgi:hypothetical protein
MEEPRSLFLETTSPSEFAELAIIIFGKCNWQESVANALKVSELTVQCWVSGASPIPGPAAAALHFVARRLRQQ